MRAVQDTVILSLCKAAGQSWSNQPIFFIVCAQKQSRPTGQQSYQRDSPLAGPNIVSPTEQHPGGDSHQGVPGDCNRTSGEDRRLANNDVAAQLVAAAAGGGGGPTRRRFDEPDDDADMEGDEDALMATPPL